MAWGIGIFDPMPTPAPRYPYALIILGYLLLFVGVYAGLYAAGVIEVLPGATNLLKWDAAYYDAIRQAGYHYTPGQADNAGFFPLFAYWWKLLSVGPVAISLLNGLVYAVSLYFLCRLLRPDPVVLGLFMSLPFLFFLFTPLAEAVYFAFATALLYGVVRKNAWLIFGSLLLAGLTRPSFLFLVPGLVGMELMMRPRNELFHWDTWRTILLQYLLPLALATLVVALVQYVQVGDALAYYKTQSEAWGRAFGWPVFPLGRGEGEEIVVLTRFSFWGGMLVSLLGLRHLVEWLGWGRLRSDIRPIELLSVIYLTMSLLSIVFFNPEWFWFMRDEHNATYLTGINRYLQPNPFLLVLLVYVFRQARLTIRGLLLGLVITHLIWLCFDPRYYVHIRNYLPMLYVIRLLLPYVIYHYFRWKPLGYVIVVYSFALQALMFHYFLTGVQVD